MTTELVSFVHGASQSLIFCWGLRITKMIGKRMTSASTKFLSNEKTLLFLFSALSAKHIATNMYSNCYDINVKASCLYLWVFVFYLKAVNLAPCLGLTPHSTSGSVSVILCVSECCAASVPSVCRETVSSSWRCCRVTCMQFDHVVILDTSWSRGPPKCQQTHFMSSFYENLICMHAHWTCWHFSYKLIQRPTKDVSNPILWVVFMKTWLLAVTRHLQA